MEAEVGGVQQGVPVTLGWPGMFPRCLWLQDEHGPGDPGW